MPNVHIDFETRSPVDLKTAGAFVYAAHPETIIMCIGYRVGRGPRQVIEGFDKLTEETLAPLVALVLDPNVEYFCAHNAQFEQAIWRYILVRRFNAPEIPIARWKCSMAKVLVYNLPAKLETAALALNLEHTKDVKGGRKTIRASKPDKKTGGYVEITEELREIIHNYCLDDVDTEVDIDEALPDIIPKERKIWELTETINQRGMAIDIEKVKKILTLMGTYKQQLLVRFREITDNEIESPTKRVQWSKWLEIHKGIKLPNTRKETIEALIAEEDLDDETLELLHIQREFANTSTTKFLNLFNSTGTDGRARGLLQYHGASTGRWAGRQVQPQNLPRGEFKDWQNILDAVEYGLPFFSAIFPDVLKALASAIRGCFMAAQGKKLYCADYSAIEARVVAWLAGQTNLLDMFRRGEDPYKYMATRIFGCLIEQVDDKRRFVGKSAVLGCGYQMGPDKYSATYNIDIALAETSVNEYRSTYPKIKNMWYRLDDMAIECVRNKTKKVFSTVVTGPSGYTVSLEFNFEVIRGREFMTIKLPSGRKLYYHKPHITEGSFGKQVSYWGIDSQTKRPKLISLYGGMITENVTQAVARDLMAAALYRLEKHKYYVVLTVHDEGVSEVDEDFGSLEEFCSLMAKCPPWARGCPVTVEGWEGKRYRK